MCVNQLKTIKSTSERGYMSLVLSVGGPKNYRENLGFHENCGFLKKTQVFSLLTENLGFYENRGFLSVFLKTSVFFQC